MCMFVWLYVWSWWEAISQQLMSVSLQGPSKTSKLKAQPETIKIFIDVQETGRCHYHGHYLLRESSPSKFPRDASIRNSDAIKHSASTSKPASCNYQPKLAGALEQIHRTKNTRCGITLRAVRAPSTDPNEGRIYVVKVSTSAGTSSSCMPLRTSRIAETQQ